MLPTRAPSSNAALFSHDDVTPGTGDLLVKMNKASAARDGAKLSYPMAPEGGDDHHR